MALRVLPVADSDERELVAWSDQLRAELSDVDGALVTPLFADVAPAGAKGRGALAGQMLARFATVGGLRAVVAAVRGWVARTGRSVEVDIGGDVLKLSRATSQQQEKIIDAWLARHAPAG